MGRGNISTAQPKTHSLLVVVCSKLSDVNTYISSLAVVLDSFLDYESLSVVTFDSLLSIEDATGSCFLIFRVSDLSFCSLAPKFLALLQEPAPPPSIFSKRLFLILVL